MDFVGVESILPAARSKNVKKSLVCCMLLLAVAGCMWAKATAEKMENLRYGYFPTPTWTTTNFLTDESFWTYTAMLDVKIWYKHLNHHALNKSAHDGESETRTFWKEIMKYEKHAHSYNTWDCDAACSSVPAKQKFECQQIHKLTLRHKAREDYDTDLNTRMKTAEETRLVYPSASWQLHLDNCQYIADNRKAGAEAGECIISGRECNASMEVVISRLRKIGELDPDLAAEGYADKCKCGRFSLCEASEKLYRGEMSWQ